jgi:hypothetical protein
MITHCSPISAISITSHNFLTESQRTTEWFLLQKFCISGTGAYGIWKQYIRNMSANLLDENMNVVIEILSMQSNGQELVEPPEVDIETYKTETLNTMLLPTLWRICQNKNLPVSGSKAIIIERILPWRSQEEPTRQSAGQSSILKIEG